MGGRKIGESVNNNEDNIVVNCIVNYWQNEIIHKIIKKPAHVAKRSRPAQQDGHLCSEIH